MSMQAIAAAIILSVLGSAQADTLFESGGFSSAAQAALPNGSVMTGSSMGVDTTFLLTQRSTVQRISFGSSLDAAALDPFNHYVLPSVNIFDLNWGFKGTSSGLEASATVVPGTHFNLVDYSVGPLTLDAGTYRIFWAYGDSTMPVYTVAGESVTASNPFFSNTLGDTSLVFQVQGVAAVPEATTLAMMFGGLGLLVCVTRRRLCA